MSLGSEVKSLRGTGIFLVTYSHTTSILYFSCADIGMIGAPSAMVPGKYTQNNNYNLLHVLKREIVEAHVVY